MFIEFLQVIARHTEPVLTGDKWQTAGTSDLA